MVYRILCRHSVHVAQIGRSLNERIRLIKTVNPAYGGTIGEGRSGGEVDGEGGRGEGCRQVKKDTLLMAAP